MSPNAPPDYRQLAERLLAPGVRAILLMGSRARGDAGDFSDVDLKLLLREGAAAPPPELRLMDGLLVSVSCVTPADVEEWFTNPLAACAAIQGLRDAQALHDPEGHFAAVQQRARAFTWDPTMQEKANIWVSMQMAGWVEEVYKGLEGLRRSDVGRLLNARFGLSWGLNHIAQVFCGVLLSGDNGIYTEVAAAVGQDSRWVRLRDMAFGIRQPDGLPVPFEQQVIAGLGLYVETARMVDGVILPEHRELIMHAVAEIGAELTGIHNEHP